MIDLDSILTMWSKPEAKDDIRDLEDGTWIMARRLMYHWMLIRGNEFESACYFDRWCYATEDLARDALAAFPVNPTADYEPEGWHRHPTTCRRRPDGDKSREYIDP